MYSRREWEKDTCMCFITMRKLLERSRQQANIVNTSDPHDSEIMHPCTVEQRLFWIWILNRAGTSQDVFLPTWCWCYKPFHYLYVGLWWQEQKMGLFCHFVATTTPAQNLDSSDVVVERRTLNYYPFCIMYHIPSMTYCSNSRAPSITDTWTIQEVDTGDVVLNGG